MKNKFLPLLLAIIALTFSACSKDLDKVLPGVWDVTEYELTSGGQTFTLNNVGEVTFNDNGTGYGTLAGGPTGTFTWFSNSKESVTVGGNTYQVLTNQPKKQVWEATSADGDTEKLTLRKTGN